MDDADLTTERTEREHAALLAATRAQAARAIVTFSACRQCEETLSEERRAAGFCSAECRDDFEKVAAAVQRSGRVKRE